MEQRRILQIAFIFFACGLSIELLKTLGIKLDDYEVQLGTEDVTLEMPVLKLANSFSGYQKINGIKLVEGKKAEGKKDAKKDELKKPDENKLAKKKKKKKKKKIDSFEPEDDTIAKKNKDKKDEFSGSNGPSSYFTLNDTIAPNPQDKNKNLPKTLQEWENLLLKDPSFEEAKKFIDLYRSREVSAEVFYSIAKKMLEDQRPQMRHLGLSLIDSSPGAMSFAVLSEAYYQEPNNSAFRSKMERQLVSYGRPESFNLLVQGLSPEKSLAVNFTSVTVLSRAIERYKVDQARVAANASGSNLPAPAATPITPSPTSNPAATVRPTRTQSLFSRFQSPLKALVAENDPNLAPSAAQVLSQILALLNS